MEVLGLIGSLIRLLFVYKLNFKKQTEASENNFGKEESKDILVGSIVMLIFVIWGVLTYSINWC